MMPSGWPGKFSTSVVMETVVPLSDAVGLVEGLGLNGRLRVLRSQYGHDAFLKETDRIDALLAAVISECAPLVYLANPDNPMGTWHEAGVVEAIAVCYWFFG